MRFGVSSGTRDDFLEEKRVGQQLNFWRWRRAAKGRRPWKDRVTKEERKRSRPWKKPRCRGGSAVDAADEKFPIDNLGGTCEFIDWALCLPRWVLRSRCAFAHHLARSFSVRQQGVALPSVVFPLPIPFVDIFMSSGPQLSRSRLKTVAMKRVTHIIVLAMNFMYLGRFASDAELRRPMNQKQEAVVQRLYNLVAACGSQSGRFDFAPGRSGPELVACLDELERFAEERGFDFGGGYASTSASYERLEHDKRLREEQIEEHPELQPYRGLCASRLKISGTGTWPLARYLDSPLYLPYEEPLFLMHNEDVSHFPTPCFESEDREEYFRLIKRWDELGLLRLHEEPLREGHYTKVFNTFKSSLHDRQIGDRRIANSRERHLAGSSSHLPNGPLLQNIFLPSGCNLRGAITDRRDFYHQCCVTSSRSCSNALPFDFSVEELAGFSALKIYREELAMVGPQGREVVGDRLGMPASERRKKVVPGRLWPGFAALYQGDHLGVEYALEAHQNLLLEEGLLRSEGRVQLNSCFPTGGVCEGLIIDDFFVISSQRRTVEKEDSAAFKRLGRARQAYEVHKLPGSVEKDVVAETTFKAAGAECDSSEETLSKGLCTLGAPAGKRLALSLLSLRAASLGAISTKLALRLAGSWTSCLLYRRCLSSIVDGFFALPHLGGEGAENLVLPLSRRHAQELVLLSVAAPLMVANLRAEVGRRFMPQTHLWQKVRSFQPSFLRRPSRPYGWVVTRRVATRNLTTPSVQHSEQLRSFQMRRQRRLVASSPQRGRPVSSSTLWRFVEELERSRRPWLTRATL